MGWILALACTISQPGNSSYVGVSSCTATACHGRAEAPDRPAWQSSYTVWASRDQHANAYAALFGDRSRRISAALAGQELRGRDYSQFLQQNCTGCHSTSTDPALLADGVSCEACHGPASEWVVRHTATTSHGKLGMRQTSNLYVRAGLCAECHVGPRPVGELLHDVNHDLIAAGHPRLTFEFTSYLSSMPAHWDVQRDQQMDKDVRKPIVNFPVQSWMAGQLMTAQASLKLLEARASRSVWPEFAEYDCYACHHDLADRQVVGKELGRPEWGVWNYGVLKAALAEMDDGKTQQVLASLRDEMSKPSADRASVKELAGQAAAAFERLGDLSAYFTGDLPPPATATLQSSLRSELSSLRHWDEWTQAYLAAKSLRGDREGGHGIRSLLEVPGDPRSRGNELNAALKQLLRPD